MSVSITGVCLFYSNCHSYSRNYVFSIFSSCQLCLLTCVYRCAVSVPVGRLMISEPQIWPKTKHSIRNSFVTFSLAQEVTFAERNTKSGLIVLVAEYFLVLANVLNSLYNFELSCALHVKLTDKTSFSYFALLPQKYTMWFWGPEFFRRVMVWRQICVVFWLKNFSDSAT